MTRFDRVKEILDLAVNGESFGGHGPFWRNLTHTQFLDKRVQGRKLVTPGSGATSNIILALRGQAPFGANIGTPGAIFNRMPSGDRPPMPDENINFIEQWINDGCPQDPWPVPEPGPVPQGLMTAQQINAFFRALDNWSNFQRTPEVDDAINVFFEVAMTWFAVARGEVASVDWEAAVATAPSVAAINLLSANQEETIRQFFGNPPDRDKLAEAFERFGDGSLPQDPLRPSNPHRMDGASMWFFWLAFAEAALLTGRDRDFWNLSIRMILLGAFMDGVFRRRYVVKGFTEDEAGRIAMRDFVRALPDDALVAESRRRFVESGIGA